MTVTLDHQQRRALDLMQLGENVFLTGMAGTGKSFLVQQFVGASLQKIEMCATTGIASLNLQQSIFARTGITIAAHTVFRWAGIGIGPSGWQSNVDFLEALKRANSRSFQNAVARVRKAECLVIDEISMLPGRIMDYLDYHCRVLRASQEPFGGIQLVVVGIFCNCLRSQRQANMTGVFCQTRGSPLDFQTAI